MISDAEKLYVSRKRGRGMGMRYVLSSLLPLLVLLLVTAALSFALSFISSMSSEIDRMIALMGSGSLYTLKDPSDDVPEDAEVSEVRTGSALAYSEEGEAALLLKGVDEGYFSGMRSQELEIEMLEWDAMNPAVLPSSLAESLSLSLGDRFTLLVWESGEGRARPFLCTVAGIFASVYPQLDRNLAFVPLDLLSSPSGYEVLLERGEDPDGVMQHLWDCGIPSETYRTMYSSLYGNVRSSVATLYPILIAVAVLAAFFSSDAAQAYIDRDRRDIRGLWMLGMERRRIEAMYFRITLSYAAAGSAIGMAIGIALAFASPAILRLAAAADPALLEYYVSSFRVTIPVGRLALMIAIMLLVSALSVRFSLRRRGGVHLA